MRTENQDGPLGSSAEMQTPNAPQSHQGHTATCFPARCSPYDSYDGHVTEGAHSPLHRRAWMPVQAEHPPYEFNTRSPWNRSQLHRSRTAAPTALQAHGQEYRVLTESHTCWTRRILRKPDPSSLRFTDALQESSTSTYLPPQQPMEPHGLNYAPNNGSSHTCMPSGETLAERLQG